YRALLRMEELIARRTDNRFALLEPLMRATFSKRHVSLAAAKTILEEALAGADENTQTQYLGAAHYALGGIQEEEGDFTAAMENLQLAVDYFEPLGADKQVGDAYNGIAMIHGEQRNYQLGIEYGERALEKFRAAKRPDMEGGVYQNMAGMYRGLKEYDKAIAMFDRAITLAREQDPPRLVVEAYGMSNKGNLLRQIKRYREAITVYEATLPKMERLKHKKALAATLMNMGRCQTGVGKPGVAIDYYRRALELGGTYDDLKTVTYQGMYLAYIDLNQADSARHYARLNVDMNGKLQEKKSTNAIAAMETKFKTAEKEREIERLEYEESLSQARITRLGRLLGLGALVLTVVGLLAYRLFRQRRRIQEQNVLINKSLSEKETLMKEIHHRVKNNLQLVSSLLTLQSDYIQDNAALDAIAAGRSRVRSMALIHQKLYLGEEVSTTVNARDYLEKLVHEVTDSLQAPGQRIQRVTDIADVDFDIDLMIPLGLITNELITNAVKYAFTNREEGLLRVSLLEEGDNYRLAVSDNGGGFGAESPSGTNFGTHLIATLAEQLEAETLVQSDADGTIHTFTFDPVVALA
ncbi:MAG: histidine kinase dimerization/phosphoacceptor domain -containing protein, partial [Bacteroidota bacterium]